MSDATTARNQSRVMEVYRRYAAGDLGGVLDALADDVCWEAEAADLPWSGCFDRAGVPDYFARLAAACEVRGYEIERTVAQDEWVVAFATITVAYRASGREERFRKVDAIRLRDGLVAEFREYYDTGRVLRGLEGR